MKKKPLAIKIAAILLIVVLVVALFPAAIFAKAETPTVDPFYLVNWDRGFTNGTYSNVYGMPYTWTKIYAEGTKDSLTDWYYPGEDGSLGYISIGLYFNGKSSSDIKTAAKWLKEEFDNMPEGTRYLNLAAMGTVFNAFVKDAIDFEDGITLMADWLDRFLTEYKSIGGKLDGIATDLEYNRYTSFYLESYFCNAVKVSKNEETGEYEMVTGPRNLDILQDIVRNERVYQEKIRPQLKELEAEGKFQFYTTGINPETGLPDNLATAKGPNTISSGGTRLPIPVSEISTINRYEASGGNASCASMWNSVLLRHLIDCINRAAYYPMLEHYPDANLSDYSHANTYSWYKGFATDGGGTGTGVMAGNTTNKVFYGSSFSEYYYNTSSGSSTKQMYYKPAGMNGAVYDETDPYYRAIMDINNQKNALYSTMEYDPDAKVSVWVPYYNYSSNTKSYGDSPYFTEVMYHLGLTDPEPFLGYIIKSEVESKGKGSAFSHDPNYASFPFALQVSNEILSELTRVAGASDREPIVTPVTWDDGFVYSGMYAGGRNIWRITPDNNKISVEDFKVNGTKAPTFSVNGITITFPQGRIIEDTDITHVGSYGYWIETPADVSPVITKNANYFEENPAFGDTFDKYNEGAFTGSAGSIDKTLFAGGYRPDTYWLKSGDGTAAIVNNNGNKALTLTGTTTITNSANKASSKPSNTIPALITAGDYYAKQQAWEVTVTMPSSFSGTIKLLSYANTSRDGFYIDASGNAGYLNGSSNNKFTTIKKLTAGNTYTFKRVIDFTAKKCDYYIYNANGTLFGSATGKALYSTSTPVSSIYMLTSGVTGTVTIDNYKLYPVGVTTNLDLYEVNTLSYFSNLNGLVSKISDTTVARTEKTTYRVSWLNNSGAYKYAVLKNSQTGEIIEKVLMAPGDSGYFTGIVDASASKPVTFVLTQESATAPSTPDYENGDFTWNGYADNMGICCYVVDQGYTKLEDALTAAKNGQAIVMIADAEMSSTAVIDSSIKINTNGYAITLADDFEGDSAITLVAGGSLTWSEGMSLDAGDKTAICVTGGTLKVTGGTIKTTGTAILSQQDAEQSAITIQVTGGTVQGANAFLHINDNATATKDVTVSILATAVTGTVESDELHFEMQNIDGTYTLHAHDVVIDAAQAPTCTETGLAAGYHYPCCNKVGLEQEVVPEAGHKWVEATYCGATKFCSVCNITDGDPKGHDFNAPVVTPPTCTENGKTTETCGVCGYENIYDITPAAHKPGSIVDENIVGVTCTEDGSKDEVRYCTVCNVETSRNKVITDKATGHTPGETYQEDFVDVTCTTDGSYDNVTYCAVCFVAASRETVIVKTEGHEIGEIEVENEVPAECAAEGSYDNVRYCPICLTETFRETVTIPALGHTDGEVQVENAVDKTCTEDGSYDNVIYCTTCTEETFRETIIVPAIGHNQIGSKTETSSTLTCTTPESYDEVVYCTVCGYEHSRKNFYTAAPGHKYVVGTTNVTCENCDYDKAIGTSTLSVKTKITTSADLVKWEPKLSIGMAPAYAKTTADGNVTTTGASANDWNLKVEWPVGGNPTLTLKDAYLVNEYSASGAHSGDYHTIYVAGSADFVILLQGENTILGNPTGGTGSSTTYRSSGISGKNTGTLTISSLNKKTDTLLIDKRGGYCLHKRYNALIIDSANITMKGHNNASNSQTLVYVEATSATYADRCDFIIRNSIVTGDAGPWYSDLGIYLAASEGVTNTSDILFQNSIIKFTRDDHSGTSTTNKSACIVKFGSSSTFTIDRCDVMLEGAHVTFSYGPTIKNYTSVQRRSGWSSWTNNYTLAPGTAPSGSDYSALEVVHACQGGDPVVETIAKSDCCAAIETVSYCVVCNARKVLESEDLATKAHTPGEKVLLQQTDAILGTSSTALVPGVYEWQYTCSVCGDTWEDTEEFLPGVLYYMAPANDYYSYKKENETIKDLTIPYYEFNSHWNNNYYTPSHTIQPGQTLYFMTTAGLNSNISGNSYLVQTTDAAIIAAGTWNVKVEYPVGGTPVMTLNNANLINCAGIWWGYAAHTNVAPLQIVLKGNNYITQTRYTNGAALALRTKSDVTITGSGKLTITTYGNYAGIQSLGGNIILDKANVEIIVNTDPTDSKGYGIRTEAGDITVNGGNLTIKSALAGETIADSICAAGNITIQNGANVTLTSGRAKNFAALNASADLTIKESTVIMANTNAGSAIKYGGKLTLEYANGFTALTSNTATTFAEGAYTYPTNTTEHKTQAEVVAAKGNLFLSIAPDKALANFTGTSVTVNENLDVNFKLDADKVDTNGTVVFTVNGDKTTMYLNNVGEINGSDYIVTLPGLAAKEMCTEITVTIYDAAGNPVSETKSDSVQAYAMRLLRDDKYAAATPENNALKTFLVDMLIYGSMAQIQFDAEGDMPTALLTADEWAYATKDEAMEPVEEKAANITLGSGYVGTTFELKSNIGMAIALDTNILNDVAYAKVTYTDYMGNPGNATITQKHEASTSRYAIYMFNELIAANGRQDITWNFYDSNNNIVLTVTDSLVNYVGRMRGNHPYMDELVKYCDSATKYFSLIN